MKSSLRSPRRRTSESLPGLPGTARVDRRFAGLLPRLRPGDVAVIDVLDLDQAQARALVDAGVVAVVDASPMISGRFPNLGPRVLAEAGIVIVDDVGTTSLAALKDGARIRVDGAEVHQGDRLVATGRVLDEAAIEAAMLAAREGMLAQLETFTHASSAVLRREQDLLLHGLGLPSLSTALAARLSGRPVIVVADPHEWAGARRSLKSFVREQRPVLVGVDGGAEALVGSGSTPELVVVSAHVDPPAAKALRAAKDVVLTVEPGAGRADVERLERLGVRPHLLETTLSAGDAALLLADAAGARVLVPVGLHAGLEEFLDGGRPGMAASYLTRLKVGSRVVDPATVPVLYSGKVRARHVWLVLLFCLLAVAVAVATTPVGQEWVADLRSWLTDVVDDLRSRIG